MELVRTGDPIDARTAEQWSLINRPQQRAAALPTALGDGSFGCGRMHCRTDYPRSSRKRSSAGSPRSPPGWISPEAYCRGNETAEVLQTKDAQLSDKSPRSTMSKKQGKSIKEKRAEKKAKSAATEFGVEALENKGKKRK
ncbi:hypothetical protein AB0H42_00960 [Nocardia sp. NPDC050799]|uniref:hypothetical protein n=1 Tax=Nocardia sp. NPDC050799 TaxID=3154842 RepID=UPI003409ECB2